MSAQPKSLTDHAYEMWTDLPLGEANMLQVKAALESRFIEFERELRDKIAGEIRERRLKHEATHVRYPSFAATMAFKQAEQIAEGNS